mgnify:CR=1 FL=1
MSEKPTNSSYPLTDFRNLTTPIIDVRSPSEYSQGHWPGAINIPLFSDKEREALQAILDLGLTDCYKPQDNVSPYTWWDYRAGAFHRDIGYRIDLLLGSSLLLKDLQQYEVHRETRHKSWCPDQPKTSDHAPVMITL